MRRSISLSLAGLLVASAALTEFDARASLVMMEANGVGYVNPTIIPDPSNAQMLADLNTAIGVYNGPASSGGIEGSIFTQFTGSANPAVLPSATAIAKTSGVTGGEVGKTPLTINLGNFIYDYLIVRWGGPDGSDAMYYIKGFNGTISIFDEPASINKKTSPGSYNASSYWLVDPTPVPEPTTVIAGALLLLPFGVSIVRVVRKSRS